MVAKAAIVVTGSVLLAVQKKFANEAIEYAKQYGITGNPDGELDAFRHAYVSGRFVQMGLGNAITNSLGQLNEVVGGNTAKATNMDLHNNQKGREWGAAYSTPEALAERIYQGLKNRELVVLKPTMKFKEEVSQNEAAPVTTAATISEQQKTFVEIALSHPSWPKLNDAEQKLALHIAQTKDADAETAVVTISEAVQATQANNNELNERGLNKRVLAEAQAESAARSSQNQERTA